MRARTLLIDNHDSYTYNLFQLIAEENGVAPIVVRNDDYGGDWEVAAAALEGRFDNIVISPGPGNPTVVRDFGMCAAALRTATVPVLGVCLGHQGIGHAFGAAVEHAPHGVMHGRLSLVEHNGEDELWRGVPSPINVVRYHSLVVVAESLPACLVPLAYTTDDAVLMSLRHATRPLWGVQFHPESIATEHGRTLLRNFRDITLRRLAPSTSRSSDAERPIAAHPAAPPPPAPPAASPSGCELRVERWNAPREGARVDAHATFAALFGAQRFAFWLDSSSAQATRNSSGGVVARPNSRFSYMGAADGYVYFIYRYIFCESC